MRRYRVRKKSVVGKVVEAVARRAGTTIATAADVLRAFAVELPEAVWGQGRVQWPLLATFEVRARKSRRIVDPRDPNRIELMKLPPARSVRALVAKSWRRRRG